MNASSHREEVERWRALRLARLLGPDGWLSLVGLEWIRGRKVTLGSDPSSDVVFPAGKAPTRLGVLEVEGSTATVRLEPGVGVTHEGSPVTTAVLRHDADGHPTVLSLGTLRFHLIRRGRDLAVRIRDTESPARRTFRGIESFPVDPRWRIEARFEPAEPPRSVAVPNVLGGEETMLVPGSLEFSAQGVISRLECFHERGQDDLFIVFGDLTNGRETYGGGRYLYASPPGEDGVVALDFNRAYNPPCVFTPYATCVLPLSQNRLPFRVESGEKHYPPVGSGSASPGPSE